MKHFQNTKQRKFEFSRKRWDIYEDDEFCASYICHRSVQSQLQTRIVPGIWHMPNYSLVSWVPKTGKNKKIQRHPKKLGPIKVFSI